MKFANQLEQELKELLGESVDPTGKTIDLGEADAGIQKKKFQTTLEQKLKSKFPHEDFGIKQSAEGFVVNIGDMVLDSKKKEQFEDAMTEIFWEMKTKETYPDLWPNWWGVAEDEYKITLSKEDEDLDHTVESITEKAESDPSLKPPKEWFDKMEKEIKAKNPSYSDEQVRKTIGSIWYKELGTKKKKELRGKEGKTYGKAESMGEAKGNGGKIIVYDNGGKTVDRYTVYIPHETGRGISGWDVLTMSDNPSSPQGVNMYSHTTMAFNPAKGEKKIALNKLPKEVQLAIKKRMSDDVSESEVIKEDSDKKVTGYEVVDHGVEGSDFFQGHGIAGTDWEDTATGIGSTKKEALEDALNQLAEKGWEPSLELEQEVERAEDGKVLGYDLTVTAHIANHWIEDFHFDCYSEMIDAEKESINIEDDVVDGNGQIQFKIKAKSCSDQASIINDKLDELNLNLKPEKYEELESELQNMDEGSNAWYHVSVDVKGSGPVGENNKGKMVSEKEDQSPTDHMASMQIYNASQDIKKQIGSLAQKAADKIQSKLDLPEVDGVAQVRSKIHGVKELAYAIELTVAGLLDNSNYNDEFNVISESVSEGKDGSRNIWWNKKQKEGDTITFKGEKYKVINVSDRTGGKPEVRSANFPDANFYLTISKIDSVSEEMSDDKKIWKMTKSEYEKKHGKPDKRTTVTGGFSKHKDAVATALNKGLSVPQEVLNDYPELKESVAEAKKEVWVIKDWAGNYPFNKYHKSGPGVGADKTFASFDDAEDWLSEYLDDNYETDRGEYEIVQEPIHGVEEAANDGAGKKTGIVKWYRHDGTGYIIADDGSGSIYFDHTSLSKMAYKPKKDDKVSYSIKKIAGKDFATGVDLAESMSEEKALDISDLAKMPASSSADPKSRYAAIEKLGLKPRAKKQAYELVAKFNQEKDEMKKEELAQQWKKLVGESKNEAVVESGKYGLHVIKFPSGKFGYVGTVPRDLAITKKDGSELSDEEFKEYKQSSNPAMDKKIKGYKELIFNTEKEAIEYAKSKGHEIKKQKSDESVNESPDMGKVREKNTKIRQFHLGQKEKLSKMAKDEKDQAKRKGLEAKVKDHEYYASVYESRLNEEEFLLKKALDSYLETMLWSSTDQSDEQGGEPLDKNYSIDDIAPEAIEQAKKDISSFYEKAGDILDAYDDGKIGHDFWLTRNRHGAGFWDGDYKENEGDGDKLTEIAQEFGEVDPYVGDDGKIYVQ